MGIYSFKYLSAWNASGARLCSLGSRVSAGSGGEETHAFQSPAGVGSSACWCPAGLSPRRASAASIPGAPWEQPGSPQLPGSTEAGGTPENILVVPVSGRSPGTRAPVSAVLKVTSPSASLAAPATTPGSGGVLATAAGSGALWLPRALCFSEVPAAPPCLLSPRGVSGFQGSLMASALTGTSPRGPDTPRPEVDTGTSPGAPV